MDEIVQLPGVIGYSIALMSHANFHFKHRCRMYMSQIRRERVAQEKFTRI